MEILTSYWHQIAFFVGVIVMAVRLESEVRALRKDLDNIKKELERRDTYVETVRLRAEVDVLNKQISGLWDFANSLRDRFKNGNGHS